jgi:site-specific DNA recombinase
MTDVIYVRFSTDMQRTESCADQERNVRRDLPRFGVAPNSFTVLKDEAVSGTTTNRDGYAKLCELIRTGQVRILAVDDQARLSRADNAAAFIRDLVYAGGRFIATGEGVDTDQQGWETRVKLVEIHNSLTHRELANRVRRGQEGRILDDGSAGDFPFGYEAYYLEDNWADQLVRRGPKPKKGVRINEEEARWVRQVFEWFAQRKSFGWIARELTRLQVPKDHRSSTAAWYPQRIRYMLCNEKYVGRWRWRETTTIRNSSGKKKQVQVPAGDVVVRERPHLRIVDDALWERAQARLAELKQRFGYKDGQKRRGPKCHPSTVYPQHLLSGLLICGTCASKLYRRQNAKVESYVCSNHLKGLCPMATQVPALRAEESMIDFMNKMLCVDPEWIASLYERICELSRQVLESVPVKMDREKKHIALLRQKESNLIKALEDGKVQISAVRTRLADLEAERIASEQRLHRAESMRPRLDALPDRAWLEEQLCQWTGTLEQDQQRAAIVLREAIGEISIVPVIAPGKKRGYAQMRFRIRGWPALRSFLRDRLAALATAIETIGCSMSSDQSPEFQVDLGEPTALDRWAPQIAAWRAEGVLWSEIVKRTRLDYNRAFVAWKRFTNDIRPTAQTA